MAAKTRSAGARKEYTKLIATLVILFVIVGTLIILLSGPLRTGKTMVLATRPVDPFDVFRGQYLAINYEISTIPLINGAREEDTVYVALQQDANNIWRYDHASLSLPAGEDFIRGTVISIRGESMSVEYGIEQFFFERGAGFTTANITVEVKVDDGGRARIAGLLHDNKPLEITYAKPSLTS